MSQLVLVQVLRGLAALSVAMLHAQHDAGALAAAAGIAWAPFDRFPWTAGVDVFFVISGFIMVHASRDLFGKQGAARVFLARRVARIVPPYWAVTSLYLAVAVLRPGLLNSEVVAFWPVVASYLFIPFARPDGAVQPLYSLGWTLNYEMFFYGIFALAVGLPFRRALAVLLGTLVALVVVGRLVPLPQPLAFWTAPILLEFVFGVGLGALRLQGLRLGRPLQALLAGSGLVLLALNLSGTTGHPGPLRALAWGIPAALIVAGAALGRDEPLRDTRLARFGVALGDASYALYLFHPFAIRLLHKLIAAAGLAAVVGPWGFVGLALAGAVLASLVVHWLFERPVTERMRLWLTPKPRRER